MAKMRTASGALRSEPGSFALKSRHLNSSKPPHRGSSGCSSGSGAGQPWSASSASAASSRATRATGPRLRPSYSGFGRKPSRQTCPDGAPRKPTRSERTFSETSPARSGTPEAWMARPQAPSSPPPPPHAASAATPAASGGRRGRCRGRGHPSGLAEGPEPGLARSNAGRWGSKPPGWRATTRRSHNPRRRRRRGSHCPRS
mmetsp:Transcript_87415/g.228077  ORF Transcript_87415/g.228077 Transcript_87415/m.228077 type:complete len:201 (+) Transcript_87415:196-798(+)